MAEQPPEMLTKLDTDVTELKSEAKITGFKIYRLEKSMDDVKVVLEKLSDVYHNQSMIQKDIVAIFKDLSDIRASAEASRKDATAVKDTMQTHVTTVKSTTKVGLAIATVLYGIGAWFLSQVLDYGQDLNTRTESLEKTIIEYRIDRETLRGSLNDIKAQLDRIRNAEAEYYRSQGSTPPRRSTPTVVID